MFSKQSFAQRKRQASGAVFSPCHNYRYLLWRMWDKERTFLTYVMLNPSTADHTQDDPTMKRCIRRAQDMGHGGMWVVNLFALRSTDPANLYDHPDPVGAENDRALLSACRHGTRIVCGWGNHGALHSRNASVVEMFKKKKIAVQALRLSKQGQPMHPLYLPYNLVPQDFLF